MKIQNALQTAKNKLQTAKIKSAALDAQILLAYVLKKNKEFLFTYPQKKLTASQFKNFNQLIKKRSTGLPVAYLINHQEFFKLDFYVNRNVLIPRPETELLVEQALKICAKNKIKNIADIGSGSGAIIISLAKNLGVDKNYSATDICKKALKVARINAQTHQVKINFLPGDLLMPLKNKKLDLIIANLPYLDIKHKNLLKSSETMGLKFEPQKALYAGNLGLDSYIEFFEQIKKFKLKPKYILIEIGDRQANDLKKIIKKLMPHTTISTIKDLCGLNRVLKIKLQ